MSATDEQTSGAGRRAETDGEPGRRVRVMHVVPSFGAGGAERVAAHTLGHLDRARFEVAAVSLGGRRGTDIEQELSTEGIPVAYLDKRPGFDPGLFRNLPGAVAAFGPDVLHTHVGALRYAWPATLRQSIPVRIHTLHNVADRETSRLVRPIHRLAFRFGVRPVAIAEEVRRSFRAVYGREDLPLIPNGIPVAAYRAPGVEPADWRRAHGLPLDAQVVVCVARLEQQKNHRLLIDAFAEVAARRPGAVLLLAGRTTALRPHLETRVAALGLSDRVRFLGARYDIADILHASDVFALASDWEGHPLTVMEAMAAGLAVVCTAVGGVPELIDDGIDGRLVPPGDRAGLADALDRLLGDDVLRETLGRKAARRAEQRFGVERMAAAYGALYLDLLGREGHAKQPGDAHARDVSRVATGGRKA